MRVVFFGTPAFAVPSLHALVNEGAEVVAVVTQPDRPRGRSRSAFIPPAVKIAAEQLGLPVLQPDRPAGDLFLASLRRLKPELGVVVAYGHILKAELLGIPRRGMINLHASLLPRHRGAAPIQAAILSGDVETGVTIMQMDEGMDTGPVLHTLSTSIQAGETAGMLTDRLAVLGAAALAEALERMRAGGLIPRRQDDSRASYAPKLERQAARIEWEAPADAVVRAILAFDPAPGAWTTLNGLEVKLHGPRRVTREPALEPGMVIDDPRDLVVAAGEGAVAIAEVQPAGRRRMSSSDWLRGSGPKPGDRFD